MRNSEKIIVTILLFLVTPTFGQQLLKKDNGNIWIATSKGILVLDSNLLFKERITIPTISNDTVSKIIEDKNYTFFDRLHQKALELLEQIEYDLTTIDSVSNFYFSTQNHKMNEVMKTLTVVSVFFMPLTFIVGVYGMNFDNLPELHWKYGYFIIWGVMLFLLAGMIYYFKKKKWF